jgi:hypothetical protein
MALKIYFCDGCNESIPLKDINENKITIDAGKIFCAKCAPKAPPKAAKGSSPLVIAILVALVGLGFGLIAFITSQQIRDVGRDTARAREDVQTIQADFAALRRDAMPRDEAEATRKAVSDAVLIMQKEIAAQGERLKVVESLVRAEVEGLERRMGEATKTEILALAKQLAALSEEWRGHGGVHEALKGSLSAIEAAITDLRGEFETVRAQRGRGGAATDSGPAGDMLPDDSSRELILALKDAEPQRRFNAVVDLARFRTPAVVTALEGMLADPETYVRDGAVRALRKINAPSSIPAIIAALRDDDYFVRSSARDALKSMTTMDIAFDPGGNAADREAKVREWEGWWSLNSERLLKR